MPVLKQRFQEQLCQCKLVFVSSFFTVWSPGIKGDGSRGGKNFIFKSERRHICHFNIAPHIKALIKRSAGRLLLLWPEEIFVGGESWWWCVPRPCQLLLLASLVFHRTCHAGSITSITVVTKLRLCRAHSRALLGLQRRPLQLVDRPGVHDVGNLQTGAIK